MLAKVRILMEIDNPSRSDSFFYWKSIVLFLIFFLITPLTLAASIASLHTLSKSQKEVDSHSLNLIQKPKSGIQVYASMPSNFPSIAGSVIEADARPEIIRQYLEKYDSPLIPHADFIVETADKYNLDYRLITAIAQQESNLCKKSPPDTFNCWGWGIHSLGTLSFSSYQEGIETVSEGLRQNYLNEGFNTLEDIMSKYTPLSPGSWSLGVSQFMEAMR